jgi:diaminohydroxyphosphoribosylaminopyrimidine deaminase/5-amino-6-(5-phosphoribosylamino)uracil reductase
VADSEARLPGTARVFRDPAACRTIWAVGRAVPDDDPRLTRGARAVRVARGRRGLSLRALMRRLGREGILHVLCEGGAELAASLLRERLVDELVLFVAPRVLGGAARSGVGGEGWSLGAAPRLEFLEVGRVGGDILIRARPRE